MKIKLPLDNWSTREQLALACSVMRSGDQNWVSVSRAIKAFGEDNRPPDWFSQKNCALQYSNLLEKVETPKRKRGDKGDIRDTPGDLIARKLSNERIEELKTLVQQTKKQYKRLRRQAESIRNGECDDSLEQVWDDVTTEKKLEEEKRESELRRAAEEAAKRAEQIALAKAAAKAAMPQSLKASPRKAQQAKFKYQNRPPGVSTVSSSNPATPDDSAIFDSISTENLEVTDEDLLALTTTPMDLPSIDSDASSEPQRRESQDSAEPESPAPESQLLPPSTDNKEGATERKVEPVAEVEEQTIRQQHEDVARSTVAPSGSEESNETTPSDNSSVDQTGLPSSSSTPDEEVKVKMEPRDPEPEVVGPTDETPVDSEETSRDQNESRVDVEEPTSPTSSISSRLSDRARSRGSKMATPPRRTPRKRLQIKEEADGDADGEDQTSDDETLASDDALSVSTPRFGQSHSIFMDSTPNSPASASQCSDTDDEKTYRAWKRSILLVWRSATQHKYANLFTHPVTDDIAKGYTNIVLRPMDLSVIKKNIESGTIKSTAEFQRDMMLMFTNAVMYNSSDHDVHQMAVSMYDDVIQHIEFVSTQTLETKPYSRHMRRSDATSDKEDDSKRRRVSTDTPDGTRKRRTRPDD